MTEQLFTQTAGINGLPKVILTPADGARAEIYLHGAHVTSWIPAGGEEQLFLSRTSEFKAGASIRGGVPVIFPQFGDRGPLPKHGFVRKMEWTLKQVASTPTGVTAVLTLSDDAAARAIWPHPFQAEMSIAAGGKHLEMTLSILNTGTGELSFTSSLHTYFRVSDIQSARVTGLGGLPYVDAVGAWTERVQDESELAFQGEVDRVYYNAPSEVELLDAGRRVKVATRGFPDVVVWNPWEKLNSRLPDLEPAGYRRMVCVEAVVTGKPVTLQPGESWKGSQFLTA